MVDIANLRDDLLTDDDDEDFLDTPPVVQDPFDAVEAGNAIHRLLEGAVNVLAREERNCVRLFVEHVVPTYSDVEFVCHFRMKRSMARSLSERFSASEIFIRLLRDGGLVPICPEKHVLAFLWFVGHQTTSYRDLADRFDMSLSTTHAVISRMIQFLGTLSLIVIKPPTQEEREATKAHFLQRKGFPGVVAAIDGSHVRIDKPVADHDVYVNRKHYYSIQMQGVVNEKRKFLNVFVGYPGSVHDARVYRNSSISRNLRDFCGDDGYILGDSAYPCLPQLITPYRDNGHLSRAQRNFNFNHSSCRMTVEHTFGILKQRFRQLYHMKLRDIARIVRLIHACCVLHNLADEEDLDLFEPPVMDDYPDHGAEAVHANMEGLNEDADPEDVPHGRDVRDELCRQLAVRRNIPVD